MTIPTSHLPAGGSAESDHTPSMRTLVIPHMKAHGRSMSEIASITHVPPALVELIAERPCTSHAMVAHKVSSAEIGVPNQPVHLHRKLLAWAFTGGWLGPRHL